MIDIHVGDLMITTLFVVVVIVLIVVATLWSSA